MMLKRSRSELNLTAKQYRRFERRREKEQEQLNNDNKMNSLVKSLESSLYETHLKSSLKKERKAQKDEAKKENKQLLNVLQQQCSNQDLSRSDISPSYSTVSMVHLQYKYEELLSSHEGLLKLLEAKVKEVRKCYIDNEKMHIDLRSMKAHSDELEKSLNCMCDKYIRMKQRKERKIAKVKFERDTIKVAHDKLVHLLHQKCMEQDDNLLHQLNKSSESNKSLLISEIRRANKLQYENALVVQENAYLQAKLATITYINQNNVNAKKKD